jgi:hypothetical protein
MHFSNAAVQIGKGGAGRHQHENWVSLLVVAGRQVPEVMSLVEAFKHYSKYASQALKVAMPKGGMGRDINPRHMQQVRILLFLFSCFLGQSEVALCFFGSSHQCQQ